MDFILVYVFFISVLITIADLIADDGLGINRVVSYAIGIEYGMLIAYVLTSHEILAPLALAMVISVLITNKIDKMPHTIGIASLVLFVGIWGLPQINIMIASVFIATGIIDEIGNDMADGGKLRGIKKIFLGERLVSDIAAFLVSLVTGQWILFVGMAMFDVVSIFTKKCIMKAESLET